MKPVLIDCDPGIDDAVAIMLAIRHPALQVEAITTCSGNVPANHARINALKILELLDAPAIPVAAGPPTPLVRPYPRDPFSHGDDGLGNAGLPQPRRPGRSRFAPQLIVEMADRHAGNLTVITLGPLTNLALALKYDPSLPAKIPHLILLGGAFGQTKYALLHATGDNPVSEWNVYVDPEAARLVFHAGFKITAIGLDVACHAANNLSPSRLAVLHQAQGPESRFLADILEFVRVRGFKSYCGLIDSLAVAAAIEPSLATTIPLRVDVETTSELTRGQTVVDAREHFRWDHLPMVDVAHDFDHSRFHDLLLSTLQYQQRSVERGT